MRIIHETSIPLAFLAYVQWALFSVCRKFENLQLFDELTVSASSVQNDTVFTVFIWQLQSKLVNLCVLNSLLCHRAKCFVPEVDYYLFCVFVLAWSEPFLFAACVCPASYWLFPGVFSRITTVPVLPQSPLYFLHAVSNKDVCVVVCLSLRGAK